MEQETAPNLLNEIESRQNEVIRLLEELENRLQMTLKFSQLQIARDSQSDDRKAA